MRPQADLSRASRERGFSLVETIAALGILALAAVPLMQLSSDALRNTSQLESRFLARTTAENVLSRAMADPEPVSVGQTSGTETQMGRGYDWSLTVYPTERDRLFRLEVQVSQTERDQILARLTTLKANRPPPPPQEQGGIDLTEP